MIEQNVLTNADLNMIWEAKVGAHPAIVTNVDSLLAKIASDLSDAQIDYLFQLFRTAWINEDASRRDREQLLELVRRLAEDDRKGDMADRVLDVLWQMTTAINVSEEILNDTLHNIVKILDFGSLTDRERRRTSWLKRIVTELKNQPKNDVSNTIPVIKLFEQIGNLFPETIHDEYNNAPTVGTTFDRKVVLSRLEQDEGLIRHVSEELIEYRKDNKISSSYGSLVEIQLRLQFIKYILTEAQIYLNLEHAVRIWEELVLHARYWKHITFLEIRHLNMTLNMTPYVALI